MRPSPTRRARALAGLVAVTAILGACSGGSDGGVAAGQSFDHHEACTRLDQLDRGADVIAQANIADPDEFAAEFERAIATYVTALTRLRTVAPVSLHEPIDELRRDVSHREFAEGAAARAQLAEFATKECGAPSTSAPKNS